MRTLAAAAALEISAHANDPALEAWTAVRERESRHHWAASAGTYRRT